MEIDNLSVSLKTNGAEKAIEKILQMADAVDKLAKGVNQVDGSKLESFAQGLKAIKGSVPTAKQATNMTSFTTAIKGLSDVISGANITQFSSDMSNLSNAVQGMGGKSANALGKATAAMQTYTNQAKQAVNATNGIAKNAVNFTPQPNTSSTSLANNFKQAYAELSKVNVASNTLKGNLAKMGTFVPTNKFKSLQEQAEKVRAKVNDLRETLAKGLESGKWNESDDSFVKKQKELESLRNEYDRLILKQRELAQEGGAFKLNPNFAKAYQGVSQAVGGVKQAFSGVGSAVKTVNGYINTFISKIRGLGSASRKTKSDTASLSDTVKKLTSELTRMGKMMKLMVTRMALRAVIKEVGNGFKSLALHSQEFDNTMSNLINSSKTLGYSFSSMIAPLINALAPALLFLIELLTKVINLINQLFSALSGAKTWAKAKDFTDKWSDSIKEANGKAKELKKTVLSFDELNQLQEKTSGGKSGANITDMFEDMPIEGWAKDLSKKIKDIAQTLFEPLKEAWRKVGEFVISSWKYAMREVGKLLADMGRDFLKVWQQDATQKIFENILETIAWIGIAIGNLARQFREAWNYNETGLHILEAIRDIILIITEHIRDMARATAEWAGKLDFKPLLESVQGFLESLKPVTDAVMGILEDFYNEVVLKFTKWVIESGLPALIDVFTRFNQEVDWEGLRSKLAELWKHLEPFMETIGEGLIIFIERVTDKLKEFINGEQFAEFLDKLGKWMDTVTPEDVADGIEKLVTALVAFKVAAAAIAALSGAATVINAIVTAFSGIASIASGVASFVSAIGGLGTALIPIIAVASAIAVATYSLVQSYGSIEEVVNKIKESVNNVVEAVKPLVANSGIADEIENLKEAFNRLKAALGGMKSFWDVVFKAFEITAKWIAGILIPIINALIEMSTDFTNALAGVVAIVSGVFDILVGLFTGDGEKIREGAEKMWEGIKGAFRGGSEFIWDLLKGFAETLISPFASAKYALVGDPIVIDMWDDIKEVFEKSVGKVIDFVTDLKDNIIKLFTDIKSKVDEKIDDIKKKFAEWHEKVKETKDNIKQSFDELKSNVSEKIDNLKSKIGEFKEDWAQKWQDAKTKFEEFKTNTGTYLEELKGKFDTFKENISKAFSSDSWTFSGVMEGLKKTFEDAKEAVRGVWNSMAEALSGDIEIGSTSFHINIPKFASGGFPEDGLFFANHNELVGEFNNGKTAVANNEQILRGIENGVYNAVSSAMSQRGGSQPIDNTIYVDGEVLARVTTRAQEKRDRRYSPQTT